MKKKNGKMVPNCVPKNEEDEKEKPQSDTMKDRENLKDLQKKKQLAQLQLRIARDQERVAKLNQQEGDIKERKLTDAEKDKMKKYEKDIDKKDFIDRYGKEEGEQIYYATITKMAKEERKKFTSPKKLPNLKIPVQRKKGKMIGRVPSTYRDTDASKRSYQVAHKEVDEWYKDSKTRTLYRERYGPIEWLEKLNITYERMLSKLDEENCSCNFDHVISESEYQGKKVKLNDPIRTSENPKKKFKVYVKNEKGTVVVVRFGDPNMGINRDDPNARKSFRARHNCSDPGPKWKARYWSCYQWRAGAKVDN